MIMGMFVQALNNRDIKKMEDNFKSHKNIWTTMDKSRIDIDTVKDMILDAQGMAGLRKITDLNEGLQWGLKALGQLAEGAVGMEQADI